MRKKVRFGFVKLNKCKVFSDGHVIWANIPRRWACSRAGRVLWGIAHCHNTNDANNENHLKKVVTEREVYRTGMGYTPLAGHRAQSESRLSRIFGNCRVAVRG